MAGQRSRRAATSVPETSPDEDHSAENDYPTPNSGGEDGTTAGIHIKDTVGKISKEPRKLLDAINSINLLGIKNNLNLPKIVAIGDQSAGKSSVIAAISGITVPRKSGLCTRCPLLINLRSSTSWKCSVSLEKHYCYHDREWERTDKPTRIEFAADVDQKDLETVLSRAQKAALNPGRNPADFVHSALASEQEVEFSPNLIRLDISAPGCDDLTFYDLPGVISQSAKQENGHLPDLVRGLVKSYIQPQSHLLLLACSLEGDIENSLAAALVNTDEAKLRCIGLLTKPDRHPAGVPMDRIRSVLAGDEFPLGHGYFVTKQPSQEDLNRGANHEQARANEIQFFKSGRWMSELSQFKHRFGTERLQAKLSDLLVARIRERIPSLSEQVNSKLQEINEAIPPDPPGDKSLSIVLNIVSNLQNQLEQHLKGELPNNGFIREWLGLCREFQESLYQCRPTLVTNTQAEAELRRQYRSRTRAIQIEDSENDDDDVKVSVKRASKRPAQDSATPSPQKRQRVQENSQQSQVSQSTSTLSATGPTYSGRKYTLEEIRKERRNMTTSTIGSHDHRADEFLILQSTKKWAVPLNNFISTVEAHIEGLLTTLLDQQLKPWESTALVTELKEHVGEYLANAAKSHQELAYRLFQAENVKPMCLQDAHLDAVCEQEKKAISKAREDYRANLYIDKLESSSRSGNFTEGKDREDKVKKLNMSEVGSDEYSEEIFTMGRVKGYYKVASASFADTVWKAMRFDIFEKIRLELRKSIEQRFKLNEDGGFEECKRLLAEDTEGARRRLELKKEKEKYEKAKKTLDDLYQKPLN